MNIVDVIDRHARARPHATAFVTPSLAIGYAETHERVRRIAATLAHGGIVAGDRVAVRLPNSPSHVLAILALARLGAVAVPLHAKRPAQELASLVERYRLSATLGLHEAEQIAGTRWFALDDAMLVPADPGAHGAPNAPGGDALGLLALTSGTTGAPKAVAFTHQRLLRLWELQQRVVPHGPGVRLLVFMGLDGNYPLQSALRMLFSGGTVLLTPTVSPASLFDAVERLGATDVIAGPSVLSHAMQQHQGDGARLPGLSRLRVGGSPMSPALLARLRRRLTPNIEITYGTTESGLIATGLGDSLDRAPHAVGQVNPWVEVQVVDDGGRAVASGERGFLRYRSDCFADSYFGGSDDEAAVFVDGWYQPGDVGCLLDDNTLVVEGRADDVINLGGTKIQPAEAESVLLRDESIHEAAVYAVPGPDGELRMLAAVVVGDAFDERAALARCRAVLGQRAPYRLIRMKQLPRNAMGKVLRQELAQRTRISPAAPAGSDAARSAT